MTCKIFSARGLPGSWVNLAPVVPYWGPFPRTLLPAALASVPFRFVFVRVRVRYLKIPLYEFLSNVFSSYERVLLCNKDEDGEAAAEEEVVAEQNDEVVVKFTEEEQWQANHKRKTTTNTLTN